MSLWKRFILVLMIGSFPFAIYYFSTIPLSTPKKKKTQVSLRRQGDKNPEMGLIEINKVVEARARELREIDVKILENKGTILKLEEDKQAFVGDLEEIKAQLSKVINGVKSHSSARE